MKKIQLFTSALLTALCLSFSIGYAAPMKEPNHEGTKHMEHMERMERKEHMAHLKEKKQLIKQLQASNKKLEKQTDKKIKKIDELMMYLPKNRVEGLVGVKDQLDAIQKSIQKDFEEISKVELSVWELLNSAAQKISKKEFESGLGLMDKAIEALEKKHEMLIKFDKDLDEYKKFLESVELK